MADDDMQSEREFNRQNIKEFRNNGGKVGGQFEGFPLIIMTSTGAKSGAERENLIAYFDIDDKLYVVGSAAGRDASPGWVFNLRANPAVTVEIGDSPRRPYTAHELPRDERDRVFESSRSARRASPSTRSAPTASSRSSSSRPSPNDRPTLTLLPGRPPLALRRPHRKVNAWGAS